MAILCVEPARYDVALRVELEAFADVDYVEVEGQASFAVALAKKKYDVVLVRLGLAVDVDALAAAPSLRAVATPTTGLDHIDLAACEARGVTVLSLRGETEFLSSIRSTAEHTWALLLALCRRLPAAHADVLAGRWRREPFLADELSGRTLGIVGYGRLGRMVAEFGVAFGMRVIATDTRQEAFAGTTIVEPVDVDTLLRDSDVVSIHLPLDASTRGFFSAERIATVKQGAFVVNTARGELIDEAALAERIASGALGGAAVDVLPGDGRWESTVSGEHPLIELARSNPRVVLTPHVGGYGRTSIARTRAFVVEKIKRVLTT